MTTAVNDLLAARAGYDPFGRPSAEKIAEVERAKAALNDEAQKRWDDPAYHREVAALVASRLDYGFEFTNLFPTYFQTINVGEFETVEVRERRGLQVFWTARGGYIDETQLQTERWELPRDTIGFHVSEFDDKLRANFAETIEALVNQAEQRMTAEINRRMFSLLQAALPSGHPNYRAVTNMALSDLNTAITDVYDAVKPNNATMPPVTIIGRRAMIDAISAGVTDASALFDPEGTAEVRRQGRLGVYRGANVVAVQNYTDENDQSYIPANELWVFGGTVGLFAFYGGMQAKSWEENTVDYRHYRGRRDVGGLVHHPEQAVRIVDSAVTP